MHGLTNGFAYYVCCIDPSRYRGKRMNCSGKKMFMYPQDCSCAHKQLIITVHKKLVLFIITLPVLQTQYLFLLRDLFSSDRAKSASLRLERWYSWSFRDSSSMYLNDLTNLDEILENKGRVHGPLARYVKLRVAHALGMPGTFSQPPTSKETAS